ncbi:Jacalin-like lectin domain [Phytophthora infestans]|uniref:Jacalin-like lectin domain n=1 Tax=Phytophthora infestans TaxID=4787 RepID=A0A833SGZ5_PHYIN|nr:Jacalin-like lectin domain [Phytophthora infestans]KAF4139611.1 Jacalin-like lectin domain [Phytophthora infestans]
MALRTDLASQDIESEEIIGGVFGGRGVGGGGRGGGPGNHDGDGRDVKSAYPTLPPGTYAGPSFGGPHGDDYTDAPLVKSGQKVLSIILRAGERVDAVILTVENPSGEENTFYHGGYGGVFKAPLALAEGEYITVMEAHAGKHKGRTRVKYIKFTTNLGNFIEGGTRTDKIGSDNAKDGYQLCGFAGRSGDELDVVSAIWTSIQPVV